MRFYGLALLVSAAAIGACGGEKQNSTTDSAATASTTPPAGASATAAVASAGAAITGQTHEVQMLQDAQGNYKFEPANVTVKQGDGIKFTMVSGGPHNVAFDPTQVPANAKAALSANMQQQVSELSSPMMMNAGESYTISFAGVPAGKYDYHCTPHLAMGMKGTITVQ
jgi:plastocyanin